jgi:immunoglobulin-binding protein 1
MINSCGDCSSHNHTTPNDMVVSPYDQLIHKQVKARDYVFRPNNLPTMTLDEFAQKEMARMDEAKLKEEEAKLNMEDDDSDKEEVAERKTYKARAWDDWKDLNEKGAGNKRG